MRPASRAGMPARFDRCAPTARNTAAKPPSLPLGLEILDPVVELEHDAQVRQSRHLGIEHGAWQAIGGNAEVHHAAGDRPGIADHDVVPEAPQVVRRRQPARSGADDQHLQAGGRGARRKRPALLDGQVAEEAFDGVDADGGVEFAAIAGRLAGVVADAAVDGGERVGLHQQRPGLAVAASLRMIEPALNRFTCRTGVIAWREQILVDRPPAPHRTVLGLVPQVRKLRQVTVAVDHGRTVCRRRASCRTASARYAAAVDRARMGNIPHLPRVPARWVGKRDLRERQPLHHCPEQPAHAGGQAHRQGSPEGHPRRSPEHGCSARPRRQGTERRQPQQ